MAAHTTPTKSRIHAGDFVEILTGEAARYCGTVRVIEDDDLKVEVMFPTGRSFVVSADVSAVKKLPKTPAERRMFWGVLGA